jgi:hypothetical protein
MHSAHLDSLRIIYDHLPRWHCVSTILIIVFYHHAPYLVIHLHIYTAICILVAVFGLICFSR